MVNEHDFEDDIETIDDAHHELEDIELADEEMSGAAKLKQLRQKLTRLDEEKKQALEDVARERADFMNAKRRLEGERALDAVRLTKKHVEKLLPLCDSFDMARSNKDLWEKTDENWRKGIEGIHTQLQQLLASYGVSEMKAEGVEFDPYKHEAIGMAPVTSMDQHDIVITVLQKGYELDVNGTMEVIRPARVIIGEQTT